MTVDASEWDGLLRIGELAQKLKRVPRTGWLLRGVPAGEAESVAGHTLGVALLALALADKVAEPIDRAKLLAMCLLHDLPEAEIGDWPAPANRFLPAGAKVQAEHRALEGQLRGFAEAANWLALWQEFEEGRSPEARLSRDADRLDLLFQAVAYERAGRRGLEEFWQGSDEGWAYPVTALLADRLAQARPAAVGVSP